MDADTLSKVAYIGGPLLLSIGAYFMRTIISRIEALENQGKITVSEPQVRQILVDKLDPIKDDLQEIKENIKKLFDLYVNNLKKGGSKYV